MQGTSPRPTERIARIGMLHGFCCITNRERTGGKVGLMGS